MSVYELHGRKALVTGGARGLGQGMAEALARAGAAVMIGDLLDEEGTETAKLIGKTGATTGFTHLDVTDEASWEQAVAATVAELGGLDILINNAGHRDLLARRRPRPGRPAPHVRGQRRRHRAGHEARPARHAARRSGRQRRLDRQHRLGRRDHRLPRHRRLLRHQVRRRPDDPDRRRGVRQARLRRPGELRLPRPGADGDGHAARRRHGRARPVPERRGRASRPSSG